MPPVADPTVIGLPEPVPLVDHGQGFGAGVITCLAATGFALSLPGDFSFVEFMAGEYDRWVTHPVTVPYHWYVHQPAILKSLFSF